MNLKFAYYNEFDPKAASWLRELIKKGLIADGEVDERSIVDVRPDEIRSFAQCHFFAGIGVCSYALRAQGWSDNTPVWTGSCPCQPFSSAGKGEGFDDERHLWPHFHWLIEQCQPSVVFGEQVADKRAEPWIDLVQTDMEAMGYAFGCVAFPSASIGAPHIRDRAYWVADTSREGLQGTIRRRPAGEEGEPVRYGSERSSFNRMANATGDRCQWGGKGDKTEERWQQGSDGRRELSQRLERRAISDQQHAPLPEYDRLAAANSIRRIGGWASETRTKSGEVERSSRLCATPSGQSGAGAVAGFWRDADWLLCRDGKCRPVEPGTFPLVDGAAARVGRLRGYGNAINAEAAKIFIKSWIEARS